MGIVAALGSALAWAVASTLFASQVSRTDTLSASALRTIGAVGFFAVAIFALGAASDVGQMSASDLLQLMGTGILLLVVGESLYTASIATIGLTRAFPTVMGLEYVFAFLLAAVLLGETVTWQIAVGSLLVIAGVYLVALYGRAPQAAGTAACDPPAGRASDPASVQAPGPLMGSRWSLLRFRGGVRGGPRGGNRRAGGLGEPAGRGAGEHTAGGLETRLPFIGRITPGFWVGFALAVITGVAWGGGIVWLSSAADGFDSAAAGSVRLWGGGAAPPAGDHGAARVPVPPPDVASSGLDHSDRFRSAGVRRGQPAVYRRVGGGGRRASGRPVLDVPDHWATARGGVPARSDHDLGGRGHDPGSRGRHANRIGPADRVGGAGGTIALRRP